MLALNAALTSQYSFLQDHNRCTRARCTLLHTYISSLFVFTLVKLFFAFAVAVLHQGHLRLILPSTNLLVVQTFKRHLSFLSTTLYCNCLPSTIHVHAFPLFLFSLNICSICFQWFMLILLIVCFLFSSTTSQSSTCSVVSSSFLHIGHVVSVSFSGSSFLHPTCAIYFSVYLLCHLRYHSLYILSLAICPFV